jgi:hypothetical protein
MPILSPICFFLRPWLSCHRCCDHHDRVDRENRGARIRGREEVKDGMIRDAFAFACPCSKLLITVLLRVLKENNVEETLCSRTSCAGSRI